MNNKTIYKKPTYSRSVGIMPQEQNDKGVKLIEIHGRCGYA